MEGVTIRSVCVFCGSSAAVPEPHRRAASDLGALLARHGITLVFGAGRVGLMGLVAEAVLDAGGRAIGVIPRHLTHVEPPHARLTELHVVETMHERKFKMFQLSDAFVTLPGGMGTLDETIEIITWKQLRLHGKPIVIVDVERYWAPLAALFESIIAAGYARPEHGALYTVVDRVDDVLAALARVPEPAFAAKDRLI